MHFIFLFINLTNTTTTAVDQDSNMTRLFEWKSHQSPLLLMHQQHTEVFGVGMNYLIFPGHHVICGSVWTLHAHIS